jgi:ribosomal protein L33
MAKKGNRTWVWMTSKETTYRFQSERNKVNMNGEKLTMLRFDPITRKHCKFIETK